MQPNFIFVGSGKSGSTSLYYYLSSHPQIVMSRLKETRFFVKDEVDEALGVYVCKTWNEYISLFPENSEANAVGEMSPEYLASSNAAQKIYDNLGKVKIVIILRNPYERATSLYRHYTRDGLFAYESINDAVDASKNNKKILIDEGMYFQYVKNYVNIFGKSNVFLETYDNFVSNPDLVVKKIFEFLNVNINHKIEADVRVNVSGSYKWRLAGSLITYARKSKVKVLIQKYCPVSIREKISLAFNKVTNLFLDTDVTKDCILSGSFSHVFNDDIRRLESEFNISIKNWYAL